MNWDDELSISEAVFEQAGHYLLLIDEDKLEGKHRSEFISWIKQSPANKRAFEQVASLWGKMDLLHGLAEIFPIEEYAVTELQQVRYPEKTRHVAVEIANPFFYKIAVPLSLSLAAVILLLVFVTDLSPWADPFPDGEATYVTQIGETKSIPLSDGSTIVANTASRLSVSLTSEKRRIVLDAGEAFFDVSPDANRPFEVLVGGTIVRAVGTAFSVYRENEAIKVIVSEGIVEVIDASDEVAENKNEGGVEKQLLLPGQVAEYIGSDKKVATVNQDELARRLIWRQGMLGFEGESLEYVVEQFSRYNDINLEIVSDDIRDVRVGGYFDSNDIEGVLSALESNFGVAVTRLTEDHVLLSQAEPDSSIDSSL